MIEVIECVVTKIVEGSPILLTNFFVILIGVMNSVRRMIYLVYREHYWHNILSLDAFHIL